MSRTGPGQSWTPKNTATHIAFGGVWPTVMALTGDATISPTGAFPPYQSVKQRKIVRAFDDIETVAEGYAGGFRTNRTTNAVELGGWWHNGNHLAISWLNGALYVGGKFGYPASPPADYELIAAAMQAKNEIVLLFRKLLTSPLRYNYVVQKNLITAVGSNTFNTGSVSELNLGDLAFEISVTGFDSTAHKLAYLTTSGTTQTIDLITLAADYSSKTTATIHTRTIQTIEQTSTVSVTGSGPVWSTSGSTTWALLSGEPIIHRLVMEKKNISVLAVKYTSATITAPSSEQSCSGRDGFSHGTWESLVNYNFVISKIDFSGSLELVQDLSGFKSERIDSYAFDYTYSTDTAVLSSSVAINETFPEFLAASAENDITIIAKAASSSTTTKNGFCDVFAEAPSANDYVNSSITEEKTVNILLNSTVLSTNVFTNSSSSVDSTAAEMISQFEYLQQLIPPAYSPDTHIIRPEIFGDPAHWAYGKKEALAQFIVDDPFSSANAQYQITVSLQNPLDYVFTNEQVLPTGANFTSQLGVTTQ